MTTEKDVIYVVKRQLNPPVTHEEIRATPPSNAPVNV